jgi:transposase
MSGCPPFEVVRGFSSGAVDLVRSSGRTLPDVGRELGVNHETLRGWVNAAKRADKQRAGRSSATDGELSGVERDELRRLRRKVAELELEKEILRKAAAYCHLASVVP